MKKSFKKAGTAVLSMAMLLAMGSVSMPVYADDPQPWPGQVKVTINENSTWANDGNAVQFEYLEKLQDAEVRIYRVAEIGENGWEWTDPFKTALSGYNPALKLSDFNELIKKTNGTNFDATSAERMELAGALERVILNDTSGAFESTPALSTSANPTAYLSTGTIVDGTANVLLPANNQLNDTTRNHVAYYLISTVTKDAGVVIQPSLISLKNSEVNPGNPIDIALKGNNINIDKKITQVKDSEKDKSLAGNVTKNDGESAVASKYDKVTFRIDTQLPKYDVNLLSQQIDNITLTDTPDTGIDIIEEGTGGGGNENVVRDFKIYAADTQAALDTLVSAGGESNITSGVDYTLAIAGNSFTITFDKGALRYGHSANKLTGDSATNTSTLETKLEGKYIAVTFTGIVDDTLRKKFTTVEWANVTDPVAGDDDMVTASTLKINDHTKFEEYLAAAQVLDSTAPTSTSEEKTALVAKYIKYLKANASGGENISTLTYPNEYSQGKNPTKINDRVKVFAVDLDLTKVSDQFLIEQVSNAESQTYSQIPGDAGSEKKIKGAVLELVKEDDNANNKTPRSLGLAITDTNGKPHILVPKSGGSSGTVVYKDDSDVEYVETSDVAWTTLGIGTYTLKEIKAPTGYTKFPDFTFKINCADDGENWNGEFSTSDESVPANNAAGMTVSEVMDGAEHMAWSATDGTLATKLKDPVADTLPATGGIGTVLFTAGGIAVVMMAGALFVIYMKKRSTEDEE